MALCITTIDPMATNRPPKTPYRNSRSGPPAPSSGGGAVITNSSMRSMTSSQTMRCFHQRDDSNQAESSLGDAQPLPLPTREALDGAVGLASQTHQLDHLLHSHVNRSPWSLVEEPGSEPEHLAGRH